MLHSPNPMPHRPTDNRAGNAMVLTDRDIKIVADVADFQILTRDQLQRLGHFRSRTRANATLLRLTAFGYLCRRYQPAVAGTQRALYLLGPQSAALLNQGGLNVAAERKRVKTLSDLFLAHQLLVNDVRLSFRRVGTVAHLDRWTNDVDLRAAALGIIPDGHVAYIIEGKHFGAFIELDRGTETLDRWQSKVHAYIRLAASGRYRQVFGHQYFRVLVVAPATARIEHLRRATARVTDKIFWFTGIQPLAVDGPLASIWWRPTGASLHSLKEI